MTTTARTPPQARQRWALALLAFALAALFCFNTAAQVPTATVGGQELKIPPPAGLMNAAPEAPLLVELLRRSFTGDKQLLALFARPQEIAESQVRKRAVRMPVSAVVFTFSEAQDKVLTPQEFLTAQAGMERDFSAAMAAALRQRQAARAASTASPAASTASSAGAQVTDIAPELLGVLSNQTTTSPWPTRARSRAMPGPPPPRSTPSPRWCWCAAGC